MLRCPSLAPRLCSPGEEQFIKERDLGIEDGDDMWASLVSECKIKLIMMFFFVWVQDLK
jgi:hypothetical protein